MMTSLEPFGTNCDTARNTGLHRDVGQYVPSAPGVCLSWVIWNQKDTDLQHRRQHGTDTDDKPRIFQTIFIFNTQFCGPIISLPLLPSRIYSPSRSWSNLFQQSIMLYHCPAQILPVMPDRNLLFMGCKVPLTCPLHHHVPTTPCPLLIPTPKCFLPQNMHVCRRLIAAASCKALVAPSLP